MTNFGCARCASRWGGLLTAHCGGCHQTFTGITAFDKHRVGPPSNRICLDPSSAVNENPESDKFGERLFQMSGRAYPCWALEGEKPDFWKEC